MRDLRKKYAAALVVLILFTIYLMTQADLEPMNLIMRHALIRNTSADDSDLPHSTEAPEISKDDVYISIKTSAKFHKSRLALILKTWWNAFKNQAYFFTDGDDGTLSNHTGGHVVVTACGESHDKYHLCCKMGAEYDGFYDSNKRWWCHFDDDNYVNPSMLVDILSKYDSKLPLYVGKPSREGDQFRYYKKKKVILRFATGGAGICITRNMSELMYPYMRKGMFVKTCNDLTQPDDVTFGFIVTNRLGINLTRRNDFNSHTQDLAQIPREDLLSQAVLSYSPGKRNGHLNIINLTDDASVFPFKKDRTRLLSYHCLKYPETKWCPSMKL